MWRGAEHGINYTERLFALSITGAHGRLLDVRGPIEFSPKMKPARMVVVTVTVLAVAVVIGGCAGVQEEATPDIVDPGWAQRPIDTTVDVAMMEPFVKLVDLARLRVGMTKEEVRAIFPDPDEIQLRGTDEMWRYGFAELLFRGNYLRDWFNLSH